MLSELDVNRIAQREKKTDCERASERAWKQYAINVIGIIVYNGAYKFIFVQYAANNQAIVLVWHNSDALILNCSVTNQPKLYWPQISTCEL